MNGISLIAWVALSSFILGATVVFMILAPRTKSFGTGRKIAGGAAIWVAMAILILPIMFIPTLGPLGLILSVMGIFIAAVSYWKWWLLWIPVP